MSEFNARKWFKNQYLEEGMSPEEWEAAKEAERLEDHPEKEKIKAIQALMAKEKSLNEISRDAYNRMEGLANERHLNELKDLIMILGEEWVEEGFESIDVAGYLEYLVYQLVKD